MTGIVYEKYRGTLRSIIARLKSLQGDPHSLCMGMALGVFIGTTPTFPFHTVLAVVLAVLLRASVPAAALGVWFGNPFTMPLFYFASYKLGMLLLGRELPELALHELSILQLARLGLDVTCALIAGGAILGLPFAIAAYFFMRRLVRMAAQRH